MSASISFTTRQNVILIVTCLAVLFEAMDIAVINLAIPLIQKQFLLKSDEAIWLQALYVLPYGGFLILGGKMADVLGRKKIFMIGSALFLFTSLGAGLSNSFYMLATFRFIQGIGAAFVLPSAISIITTTFTDSTMRGRAIGVFSAFAALGSGLGLSVGGVISAYAGWQWAFFINVPTIGLSMLLGYIYIEKDVKSTSGQVVDIFSAVLLTAAIISLSYVVHDFANFKRHAHILLGVSTLVVAALWIFMDRNKRAEIPHIDFSLFRNRTTIVANGVTFIMGAFFHSFLFTISLLFQSNMHYSAAHAGLLIFPFAILSAVTGKFIYPLLMKVMTTAQIAMTGMSLFLLGGVSLFCAIYFESHLSVVLFSIACVNGFGMAISFPSLTVMAVSEIPVSQHGLASSMSSTFGFMGGGLGLSVIALLLQVSGNDAVGVQPILAMASWAVVGMGMLVVVLKPARTS
jgi:MFS family permease